MYWICCSRKIYWVQWPCGSLALLLYSMLMGHLLLQERYWFSSLFFIFIFIFFPLDCLVEYLSREWLFCKNCLHNLNIAYTLYFVFDAMLSSQLLVGHSRNLRIHAETLKGTWLISIFEFSWGLVFSVFSSTDLPIMHWVTFFPPWLQFMTVCVAGGSDLSKISEQLGKTGSLYLALSF